MKALITPARVRAILAGTVNERDISDALRRHRVRFSFSTEGGYMHIRIPARSGIIRVYRTASRSGPVIVSGRRPPVILSPVPGASFYQ